MNVSTTANDIVRGSNSRSIASNAAPLKAIAVFIASIVVALSLSLLASAMPFMNAGALGDVFAPRTAYADVQVGDTTLDGYEPGEIVSTDIAIDASTPEEVPAKAEDVLIKIIMIAIPIVAVAAVGLIVYNAVANIFRKAEDRVKMGDLIKNIFVNFFFILFAWIIVELIIYAVTGAESFVVATLM